MLHRPLQFHMLGASTFALAYVCADFKFIIICIGFICVLDLCKFLPVSSSLCKQAMETKRKMKKARHAFAKLRFSKRVFRTPVMEVDPGDDVIWHLLALFYNRLIKEGLVRPVREKKKRHRLYTC